MSAPTRESPSSLEAPAQGAIARPRLPVHRSGRWIDHWDPEDTVFWRGGGRAIARRNLAVSVFAEFLGFCVWALWSVVVPHLPAAGFSLTLDQQFWLIALPSLVGATVRIPYTFAVPVFGGRNWTIVSALLLVLPAAALAWAVSQPGTSFGTLLLCAALAGLGGGNFASSMTNISFFFPEAEKGKALGLNAAGGNLGTGIVQLAVPAIIAVGAGTRLERAGLVFIPLALLAALLAWRGMDNLSGAKADYRSFASAARNRHTWTISFLYIGTFGSFIGYSGVFPTLLKSQFPNAPLTLAFSGALVGALARPLGGIVADRVGGARITLGVLRDPGRRRPGCDQRPPPAQPRALLRLVPAPVQRGGDRQRRDLPDDPGRVPRRGQWSRRAGGRADCGGRLHRHRRGRGGVRRLPHPPRLRRGQGVLRVPRPALWVFVGAYVVMAAVTYAVYARRGAALAAERV